MTRAFSAPYYIRKELIKIVKLILDMDVVNRYDEHYFKQHPKAKKKPIEHPYHPSLNVYCIKPRIQMNAMKQQWKDFIIFWIKELGYENKKLDDVKIVYDIYHPTKRRTDPDNFNCLFCCNRLIAPSSSSR